MKLKVFVLKPNLDEARIEKIISQKIDKFMADHRILDQQVTGYSDSSVAIALFYEEKKSNKKD